MRIPLGREHSAEAHGAARRDVFCEECGTHYVYIMERTGMGEGFSPLFLDESGAENRAEEKAERNLAKMMDDDVDPVPCPGCGHFQTEMISVSQSRQYVWMGTAAIFVMIAFAILLITALVETSFTDSTSLAVRIAAAMTGGLAFGLAFGQKRLQQSYDPNTVDLTERLKLGHSRSVMSDELAEHGLARLEKQVEQNIFAKALWNYREALFRRFVVCLILLWFGALFCRSMSAEAMNGIGSLRWPTSVAVLDELKVVGRPNANGSTSWRLGIKYHFDVDGVTYTGARYRFCPEWTSDKISVEKQARQFAVPDRLTASYSVGNPSVNALTPGLTPGRYLLVFLSAGIFLTALGLTLRTAVRAICSRAEVARVRDEVMADEDSDDMSGLSAERN